MKILPAVYLLQVSILLLLVFDSFQGVIGAKPQSRKPQGNLRAPKTTIPPKPLLNGMSDREAKKHFAQLEAAKAPKKNFFVKRKEVTPAERRQEAVESKVVLGTNGKPLLQRKLREVPIAPGSTVTMKQWSVVDKLGHIVKS